MTRFRYSPSKFWISLIVALGLTFMVTGLTWMIFTRLGNPNAGAITAAAGFVFLAFFSAKMAMQYFRDDIVLSILPMGIEDVRWGRGLVEWDEIKEITLAQRERTFEIKVILWPQKGSPTALPIDLDALESDVETVTKAIMQYTPIRSEY